MAVTVASIYSRFSTVLNDAGHTRWTEAEFILWFNEAELKIVELAPESNAQVVTLALVGGSRQQVAGIDCIEVIQNTDGAAITPFDPMAISLADPTWHNNTQTAVVKHWAKHMREKRGFYVYPPNTGTGSVEVMEASKPTPITATTGNIGLPDEYDQGIVDYCLYRAFAKEDEAADDSRAQKHLAAFMALVGTGSTEQPQQGGR